MFLPSFHAPNPTNLPSLFLYAFLSALFVGTCSLIYTTWIKAYLPQPKRTPRTTARKSAPAETEATTSGAKAFDQSWIDERHLKRPEAKRVRSGAPKTKAK